VGGCRRTGELTKVVDRGTAAIQNMLSTILCQIVPQVGRQGGHMAAGCEEWPRLSCHVRLTMTLTQGVHDGAGRRLFHAHAIPSRLTG
jgi:hypothetical protein